MRRVDAGGAHAMIHDGQPLAPLDLREAGQFGEGHALFAMPLPYSRLETRIADLVPRLSERILLMDQGDGIAERAARRLAALGYDDLHLLSGGMPAWEAAGLGIFKGVNVPSKLLGELAEAIWHPDLVTPDRLAAWQAEGRAHCLFDARPAEEYAKMRVPGAICLPNGELPHHAAHLPRDAPVVITCAGRTRGIVGAIGLRLSGHDGPIHALENGTQGWALSGRELERDNRPDSLPAPDPAAQAASRRAAQGLMTRFDLPCIEAPAAEAMLRDGTRTTYLVDVRSGAEARADPIPGAVHAPSGQLVQATDQWLAVRHARVILCCDTGLRASLAAFWLRQLGYQPFVLPRDEVRALTVTPDRPQVAIPAIGRIDAAQAMAAMGQGARLIDLRGSMAYRAGHVAGARWGNRARLVQMPAGDPARPILLVADDPSEAAFAADDLRAAGHASVRIVAGGHDALRRAGAAIEASPGQPAQQDCIDHLFFVHDRHSGNLDAARRYLAWETGLIAQISPAERDQFDLIRP